MPDSNDWRVYLLVGVLSLAKAIVLRRNRKRLGREVTDAAVFIAIAAGLRYVQRDRPERRREGAPDWLETARRRLSTAETGDRSGGVAGRFDPETVRRAISEGVAPRVGRGSTASDRDSLRERLRSR